MGDKNWGCWKLESSQGRQVWRFTFPDQLADVDNFWKTNNGIEFLDQHSLAFSFDKSENPNSADRVFRSLRPHLADSEDVPHSGNPEAALKKGISYFGSLQLPDGHWAGDYGGPMFLLPGLVIASYITDTPFPPPYQILMKRYMLNHQNSDGGWGLHIEGSSTMFGTVMQYVALRLLGSNSEDPELAAARDWILDNGGATGIPSWGKFYLSILGVYEWRGNNSLLPEMWLLPRILPVHPGRYWCHCRMVYLPMSYCFGAEVTGPITSLIQQIRGEIYSEEYDKIDWIRARNACCDLDRFTRSKRFLKWFLSGLNKYEDIRLKGVRRDALKFVLEYVQAEDEQTNYVNIGPVNKVINSICIWHAYGSDSDEFRAHTDRWYDYLWLAEDGMKMSGYNGSQLWDTAFASQAILESDLGKDFSNILAQSYKYLETSQVKKEVRNPKRFFRHNSVGGWPFSTVDHGWPITDCTSEGLLASLAVHDSGIDLLQTIDAQRLGQAADLLLSFQNKDGGWATYELTRGPSWLESFNPSEVFGDIMIDYSYTECTSACIRSLARFHQKYLGHKPGQIRTAIDRGARFIQSRQLSDGSWIGRWGVCFTYGTWFGVEGLIAAGMEVTGNFYASHIDKACKFLIARQNSDGGWGESYKSCVQKEYIPSDSQVVSTSWALLTLMAGKYSDLDAIDRGVALLLDRQEGNGDWPQESISGVFNSNCMISYSNYRNIFPIWALGRYRKMYGKI